MDVDPSFATKRNKMYMGKGKFIIDTDCGVDDA